jgi:hypothetical protein
MRVDISRGSETRSHVILPREARRSYEDQDHPRQFRRPALLFDATSYFKMIDWDAEQKTEPPLTMELSDAELLEIIRTPLVLPHFPCHTQHVERLVPLVTEAALQRVGYLGRHRFVCLFWHVQCCTQLFQRLSTLYYSIVL